jgi:hypothetical protein
MMARACSALPWHRKKKPVARPCAGDCKGKTSTCPKSFAGFSRGARPRISGPPLTTGAVSAPRKDLYQAQKPGIANVAVKLQVETPSAYTE